MWKFSYLKDSTEQHSLRVDTWDRCILHLDTPYLLRCGVLCRLFQIGSFHNLHEDKRKSAPHFLCIYVTLELVAIIIYYHMQEVKFSLNPTLSVFENGFSETDIAEVQEQIKERLGYFQSWGSRIVRTENAELQETIGIIVEAETGKVYMVNPSYITFPQYNASKFEPNNN